MFIYKKLGKFTYNVIEDESAIKPFLLKWIGKEWEADHAEFPDQLWTLEWMQSLPVMTFKVEIVEFEKIIPRKDLMEYQTGSYNFIEELNRRASEREESMLRGISIEPLLVRGDNMELMDGYTRYMVLRKHQQGEVYAYVGALGEQQRAASKN